MKLAGHVIIEVAIAPTEAGRLFYNGAVKIVDSGDGQDMFATMVSRPFDTSETGLQEYRSLVAELVNYSLTDIQK